MGCCKSIGRRRQCGASADEVVDGRIVAFLWRDIFVSLSTV